MPEFTTDEKIQLEDLITELFERGMSVSAVKGYVGDLVEEFADTYNET